MKPVAVRTIAAVVGAATALACGAAAGGWWWVAALVGAGAAVGSAVDRQLTFAQVLAALALVGAVVGADREWLVGVLAGGTIASVELAAAADRTSVVRPRVPDLGRAVRSAPAAAAIAGAVLVVGEVSTAGPALAPAGAALSALVAIRVIAR